MKKAEIYTYPSFYKGLNKLATNDIGRVFKKIYTNSGDWKFDKEDKPYNLKKASFGTALERKWSRGGRVIYVKDGNKIYLFSVGNHDEHTKGGGLTEPKDLKKSSVHTNYVNLKDNETPFKEYFDSEIIPEKRSQLFFSRKSPKISEKIIASLKQPMKEITFVSPFLSEELFEQSGLINKLIQKHFIGKEKAEIRIITSPPKTKSRLKLLNKLELDGWRVDWCENLHAKIYIFKPNASLMDPRTENKDLFENCFLIGSANLTKSGLGLYERGNHEICENLNESLHNEAEKFIKFISKSFYNGVAKTRHSRKLEEV